MFSIDKSDRESFDLNRKNRQQNQKYTAFRDGFIIKVDRNQ